MSINNFFDPSVHFSIVVTLIERNPKSLTQNSADARAIFACGCERTKNNEKIEKINNVFAILLLEYSENIIICNSIGTFTD